MSPPVTQDFAFLDRLSNCCLLWDFVSTCGAGFRVLHFVSPQQLLRFEVEGDYGVLHSLQLRFSILESAAQHFGLAQPDRGHF